MNHDASEAENSQRKPNARSPPLPTQQTKSQTATRARLMRSGSGGAKQLHVPRPRPPVPPAAKNASAAAVHNGAIPLVMDSGIPLTMSGASGAIPLTMSSDSPFVPANKNVQATAKNNIRSRLIHSLRVVGRGAKSAAKSEDSHSKPVAVPQRRGIPINRTRRRKISAPQPPTKQFLRTVADSTHAAAASSSSAAAVGRRGSGDGVIGHSSCGAFPRPDFTDDGDLDMGLLFGEDSPSHDSVPYNSSARAYSFDDEDSVEASPAPSTQTKFNFVPPHEQVKRRARARSASPDSEPLFAAADSSDASSQL